jgi:hypothetical protein
LSHKSNILKAPEGLQIVKHTCGYSPWVVYVTNSAKRECVMVPIL